MTLQNLLSGGIDYVQDTEPDDPDIGETWLDASEEPAEAVVYVDFGDGAGPQWVRESTSNAVDQRLDTPISDIVGDVNSALDDATTNIDTSLDDLQTNLNDSLDDLDTSISQLETDINNSLDDVQTTLDDGLAGVQTAVDGAGDMPGGVERLLHHTEDEVDTVFTEEAASAEIAGSLIAMDKYVAEREFIIDVLVDSGVGMQVMAQTKTALRELLDRTTARDKMFRSETASQALSSEEASMEEITRGARRDEFDHATDEDEAADALIDSEMAMGYITESEPAMDVIAPKERIIVDRIQQNARASDQLFDADYRVGRSLRTVESSLSEDLIDGFETYSEILDDEDAVDEITDFESVMSFISSSPYFALHQLIEDEDNLDLVASKELSTKGVVDAPASRASLLLQPHVVDSFWSTENSKYFWRSGTPEPPETVEGNGIEAEIDIVTDTRTAGGRALNIDWVSDDNEDDLIGSEIELDLEQATDLIVHIYIEDEDLGHVIVDIDGERHIEERDDEMGVGEWQERTIDIESYDSEEPVTLGITMMETGVDSEGVIRFADIKMEDNE